MRYDLHLRRAFRDRAEQAASQMSRWEARPRIGPLEADRVRDAITPFAHSTVRDGLRIAGVDGTGDFPTVSYGDSFVHCALAQATVYVSDRSTGLREVGPALDPVFDLVWVPEDQEKGPVHLDGAFQRLAGLDLVEVIRRSDYWELKEGQTKKTATVPALLGGLIRPHGSDLGNIGIQLRSTAELGAALRVLQSADVRVLLLDGTLTLPFVGREESSLFYEHLRRLCCVEARAKGTALLAVSKSHGLPAIDALEELARQKLGLGAGQVAEHWFLRVPVKAVDGWELSLTEGRTLPPVGGMTYLVRFHRTTPVLRIDLDVKYWLDQIWQKLTDEICPREVALFQDLDYASHDQRCYGYPYPLKAGHDRASLTEGERQAIRKQVIDAAVRAGMKPALFRSASAATGHE
jgi:hypothetical protein